MLVNDKTHQEELCAYIARSQNYSTSPWSYHNKCLLEISYCVHFSRWAHLNYRYHFNRPTSQLCTHARSQSRVAFEHQYISSWIQRRIAQCFHDRSSWLLTGNQCWRHFRHSRHIQRYSRLK